MFPQMQADNTANAHGSPFRRIPDGIQITGKVAGVDHHASIEAAQHLFLLCMKGMTETDAQEHGYPDYNTIEIHIFV